MKSRGEREPGNEQPYEISYSIELPFGRLVVSKGTDESLQIVPLVPTIEDTNQDDSKPPKNKGITILAVSESELEQLLELNTAITRTALVSVPDGASKKIKQMLIDEIGSLDPIEYDVDALRVEFELTHQQRIAHNFVRQVAESAATQLAEHHTDSTIYEKLLSLKFKLIAAGLGAVGASSIESLSSLQRAAISGSISTMLLFSAYRDATKAVVANDPRMLEMKFNIGSKTIYDAVHNVYCKNAADERLEDMFNSNETQD